MTSEPSIGDLLKRAGFSHYKPVHPSDYRHNIIDDATGEVIDKMAAHEAVEFLAQITARAR